MNAASRGMFLNLKLLALAFFIASMFLPMIVLMATIEGPRHDHTFHYGVEQITRGWAITLGTPIEFIYYASRGSFMPSLPDLLFTIANLAFVLTIIAGFVFHSQSHRRLRIAGSLISLITASILGALIFPYSTLKMNGPAILNLHLLIPLLIMAVAITLAAACIVNFGAKYPVRGIANFIGFVCGFASLPLMLLTLSAWFNPISAPKYHSSLMMDFALPALGSGFWLWIAAPAILYLSELSITAKSPLSTPSLV